MKKLLYICTLLIVMTGCASQKEMISLNKETNEATLKVGQECEIQFRTNASTGYWWQLTNEKEISVVAPQDRRYENNAPAGMIGASSELFWKFQAKEKGTQTLKFVYARDDWENAIRTRDVTITVK